MCMKDVVDGRRRYTNNYFGLNAVEVPLKPNRKRVAIEFSLVITGGGDIAYTFSGTARSNDTIVSSLTYGSPTVRYDVEEFGSLVTGPWIGYTVTGFGIKVTEVIIDDETTPQLQT